MAQTSRVACMNLMRCSERLSQISTIWTDLFLAHRGQPQEAGPARERLLIAPHSATELVGRLVAAGYVSRKADPADKRRQTLELTEKADDVLKRLTAIHMTEIRDMAPKLIDILQGLQTDGEIKTDPWSR